MNSEDKEGILNMKKLIKLINGKTIEDWINKTLLDKYIIDCIEMIYAVYLDE